MTSTTPTSRTYTQGISQRPPSRTQLPSRPTTPLRAPSRTSLRASTAPWQTTSDSQEPPTASLEDLEPGFADLSAGMAELESNFLDLKVLDESVSRFNENFASFLYGLNMSAFCVDFPEAPGIESLRRIRERAIVGAAYGHTAYGQGHDGIETRYEAQTTAQDGDATFLTTDTSFVEHPPASTRPASKFTNPMAGAVPSSRVPTAGRGAGGTNRGQVGIARGTRAGRGTGIGRARGREQG